MPIALTVTFTASGSLTVVRSDPRDGSNVRLLMDMTLTDASMVELAAMLAAKVVGSEVARAASLDLRDA